MRILLVVAFFVSVGLTSTVLQPANEAHAIYNPAGCGHDDWDLVWMYKGYYSNRCPVNNVTLLPHRGTPQPNMSTINNIDEISYGYVIPRAFYGGPDVLANTFSKTDFYNKLLAYNQSPDPWTKMGAAYVVHLALGDNWGGSTTITPAQWADLNNRLSNPSLTMSWSPNYDITNNSSSVYLDNNMARFPDGGFNIDMAKITYDTQTFGGALYFTIGASTVFAIEVKCANVLGTFPGFPAYTPYDLTPSIRGPSGVVEAGGVIAAATPHVNNTGATSPASAWQLTETIVPPGGSISLVQTQSTSLPCINYGSPANNCNVVKQGNQAFASGDDPTIQAQQLTNISVPDKPPGTRICFALSVMPYGSSSPAGEWRHSPAVCVVIAKSPKVQIWGGDLRTRGNITTSVSARGAAQFGSWVEYAAFSTGSNAAGYNFASGSGFAGGTTASIAQRNLLTFANTGGSYGKYALPATPGVAAQFTTATPVVGPSQPAIGASSLSLSGYASGTYKLTSGNVTLNASDLKGTSIVLIAPANGTITIAGDINYKAADGSDTFTDPSKLPQLIIIAKTINISGAAQNVNAWLLTTGAGNAVNTCSDVAPTANLDSNTCKNQLIINGPVMTDTLYLRRTAGADNAARADTPAETFNLRADAYLWASAMTTGAGRVQTNQLTEAAPRF
jgi:hypothetical protein